MKEIIFEKVKKFEHIIGKEYRYYTLVKDSNDLQYYYDEIYGDLSCEEVEYQSDVFDAIHKLENGFYHIDHGDFWLNVTITDY